MSIIVTVALLALPGYGSQNGTQRPFPEISAQAKGTIAKLTALAERRFLNFRDSISAHERFLKLLSGLATEVPKDVRAKVQNWKGHTVEKTLILIAFDYVQHPERYRELLKIYGKPAVENSRVLFPPELHPKHLKPQFWAAWNLLLLAPRNHETAFMDGRSRSRIVEAIGAIRHDDSLPVLEKIWEKTTHKTVLQNSRVVDYQFHIVLALYGYANESALRTMLKCLALSDNRVMGKAHRRRRGKTLREWTLYFLSYVGNDGKPKEWLKILRKFPKDKLSQTDKRFVQGALAKLEQNLKAKRKP